MTISLRARSSLLLASLVAIACDRGSEAEPAAAEPPPPTAEATTKPASATPRDRPDPSAQVPAGAPPADKPAPADTPAPADAPAPATEIDESFEALATRLAAEVSPGGDPHAAGFRHLKAREYSAAEAQFAAAAKRDAVAWKHPFNLACAAAKNGDETIARIALVEAVRRGGDAVVAKAERDADLASVRTSAWFQPVLRGDPWPTPPVAAADPPAPEPGEAPARGEAPADVPAPGSTDPATGSEIPRGVATPIAKAELSPVLTELTEHHHAKPVVRASLRHEGKGGTAVGWIVYEYSRFDACVGEHADAKVGKKECKRRLGPDPEDESAGPGELECTSQWLARISPLGSGTVADRQELKVACALKAVRRLDALDIDADGEDEIVVDVVGQFTSEGFRESENIEQGRALRILRLDGTEQLKLDTHWTLNELAPEGATAHRVTLHDADTDGHPDLLISTQPFTATTDLQFDDTLWPKNLDEDLEAPPTTTLWPYDRGKDAWIDPSAGR